MRRAPARLPDGVSAVASFAWESGLFARVGAIPGGCVRALGRQPGVRAWRHLSARFSCSWPYSRARPLLVRRPTRVPKGNCSTVATVVGRGSTGRERSDLASVRRRARADRFGTASTCFRRTAIATQPAAQTSSTSPEPSPVAPTAPASSAPPAAASSSNSPNPPVANTYPAPASATASPAPTSASNSPPPAVAAEAVRCSEGQHVRAGHRRTLLLARTGVVQRASRLHWNAGVRGRVCRSRRGVCARRAGAAGIAPRRGVSRRREAKPRHGRPLLLAFAGVVDDTRRLHRNARNALEASFVTAEACVTHEAAIGVGVSRGPDDRSRHRRALLLAQSSMVCHATSVHRHPYVPAGLRCAGGYVRGPCVPCACRQCGDWGDGTGERMRAWRVAVSPDTGGHCCWPQQVWSTVRAVCIGIPACPSGFHVVGEACAGTPAATTEASCPPGRLKSLRTPRGIAAGRNRHGRPSVRRAWDSRDARRDGSRRARRASRKVRRKLVRPGARWKAGGALRFRLRPRRTVPRRCLRNIPRRAVGDSTTRPAPRRRRMAWAHRARDLRTVAPHSFRRQRGGGIVPRRRSRSRPGVCVLGGVVDSGSQWWRREDTGSRRGPISASDSGFEARWSSRQRKGARALICSVWGSRGSKEFLDRRPAAAPLRVVDVIYGVGVGAFVFAGSQSVRIPCRTGCLGAGATTDASFRGKMRDEMRRRNRRRVDQSGGRALWVVLGVLGAVPGCMIHVAGPRPEGRGIPERQRSRSRRDHSAHRRVATYAVDAHDAAFVTDTVEPGTRALERMWHHRRHRLASAGDCCPSGTTCGVSQYCFVPAATRSRPATTAPAAKPIKCCTGTTNNMCCPSGSVVCSDGTCCPKCEQRLHAAEHLLSGRLAQVLHQQWRLLLPERLGVRSRDLGHRCVLSVGIDGVWRRFLLPERRPVHSARRQCCPPGNVVCPDGSCCNGVCDPTGICCPSGTMSCFSFLLPDNDSVRAVRDVLPARLGAVRERVVPGDVGLRRGCGERGCQWRAMLRCRRAGVRQRRVLSVADAVRRQFVSDDEPVRRRVDGDVPGLLSRRRWWGQCDDHVHGGHQQRFTDGERTQRWTGGRVGLQRFVQHQQRWHGAVQPIEHDVFGAHLLQQP